MKKWNNKITKKIPNILIGIASALIVLVFLYLTTLFLNKFLNEIDGIVGNLANITGLATFIVSVITFTYTLKLVGRNNKGAMTYEPGSKQAILIITRDRSIEAQVAAFWREEKNKDQINYRKKGGGY